MPSRVTESAPSNDITTESNEVGVALPPEGRSQRYISKAVDFFDRFRKTRLGMVFLDVLYETGVMIMWLSAIKVMHVTLDILIKDLTLWSFLKISYIIDTGHILAIGRFLLELLNHFLEGTKDIVNIVRGFFKS